MQRLQIQAIITEAVKVAGYPSLAEAQQAEMLKEILNRIRKKTKKIEAESWR